MGATQATTQILGLQREGYGHRFFTTVTKHPKAERVGMNQGLSPHYCLALLLLADGDRVHYGANAC